MNNAKNDKTLEAYNEHIQAYVAGTVQTVGGTVKKWLDTTFSDVKKSATIFELGSGFGRDAHYLGNLGYTVHCTDAAIGFVKLLRSKGLHASKFNAITDDFPKNIDVVFANAVLLHFTRDETKRVLNNVFAALRPGGTFAFTLKQGLGEEWSEAKLDAPRFFCYWDQTEITTLLQKAGYKDITVWSDQKTTHATWLQIIARKP